MEKITYDKEFFSNEEAKSQQDKKFSDNIAQKITDAISEYDIELGEEVDIETNESAHFIAWVHYCLNKYPDEDENDVFDAALEAFSDEFGVEDEESGDVEIEVKASAQTKLRLSSDKIYKEGYNRAERKFKFAANQISMEEVKDEIMKQEYFCWDDLYILGFTPEMREEAEKLGLWSEDIGKMYKDGEDVTVESMAEYAKKKAMVEAAKQKAKAEQIIEEQKKILDNIDKGEGVKGSSGSGDSPWVGEDGPAMSFSAKKQKPEPGIKVTKFKAKK